MKKTIMTSGFTGHYHTHFKPSRGREKIILKEKGVLEYTPIAPNDAPESFKGTWETNKSSLVLKYNKSQKLIKH